jgi:hypothetical protein
MHNAATPQAPAIDNWSPLPLYKVLTSTSPTRAKARAKKSATERLLAWSSVTPPGGLEERLRRTSSQETPGRRARGEHRGDVGSGRKCGLQCPELVISKPAVRKQRERERGWIGVRGDDPSVRTRCTCVGRGGRRRGRGSRGRAPPSPPAWRRRRGRFGGFEMNSNLFEFVGMGSGLFFLLLEPSFAGLPKTGKTFSWVKENW